MNDCYLSLLLNFRALLSIDSGANLVNSKQAIGVILPDLSLLGYAVPVESFGIGLFIVLFAYLAVEYNVQLLSPSNPQLSSSASFLRLNVLSSLN